MKIRKMICFVLAVVMIMQVQPIYAAQTTENGQVENSQDEVSDMVQNNDNPGEDEEEPDNDNQGEDEEEPDSDQDNDSAEDEEEPDDNQNKDDSKPDSSKQPNDTKKDKKKKIPRPSAVTGLRTTAQSQTKVCIEWKTSKNTSRYLVYRRQGSGKYKKIATTKKTSYIDKKIKSQKTYHYKIVPENSRHKKGKSAKIAFSNRTIVKISSKKYTYGQMKQQMNDLKSKYSDYCDMTVIGKSVKGRNLYDFSIGNPDADSSILVVGTLHAREYICAAVLMQEIEYYLSNYNCTIGGVKPAKVLKNTQIHYVVMANPDGVDIAQSTQARWKSNASGVDLNRNFPAKKFIAGGKKGAQGYSGKKALSEPESKAVSSLTLKLKKKQSLQGVVNYHAMGRIIYGSCLSKKLYNDTKTMYNIAQKETGYSYAYEAHPGNTAPGGQYREYVMYMLGIPSITIEVGKTIAPCSYYEYKTEFQKNKHVVLKIAKAIG